MSVQSAPRKQPTARFLTVDWTGLDVCRHRFGVEWHGVELSAMRENSRLGVSRLERGASEGDSGLIAEHIAMAYATLFVSPRFARRLKRNVNVVPRGPESVTSIVPPCAAMILRHNAKPKPYPPVSRTRDLSTR